MAVLGVHFERSHNHNAIDTLRTIIFLSFIFSNTFSKKKKTQKPFFYHKPQAHLEPLLEFGERMVTSVALPRTAIVM